MTAGDSKASKLRPRPSDVELMRRLAIAVALIGAFTAAFSLLYRFYSRKFDDVTGPAQWIWARHQISRNLPVVFFAARDFDLPATRRFTKIKVFADPEYTLWFNGREIAGRRASERRALDLYDVSQLARTGRNRILIAVRSTNGVGGLIAAVDTNDTLENVIYTDQSWRIYRTWNDALPVRDVPAFQSPMILGSPPVGRWHFLQPAAAEFDVPPAKVINATNVSEFIATIPTVKIVEGVAVATKLSLRARAYDFGFTSGRVRFTVVGNQSVPPVVRYRLANVVQEFGTTEAPVMSVPFAAGERTLTEPVKRSFRYVVVFGGRATAQVVQ